MIKRVLIGFTIAILAMSLALLDANYLFLGKWFAALVPCETAPTSSMSCTASYDAVLILVVVLVAAGGLIYALGNLWQLAQTKRER